jgi:BirA family transcriptional regulator, biotin operon repressor / biotin---[acetyl-CoA-carboxylase] ligase
MDDANHLHFHEVDSTNRVAMELVRSGRHGRLVITATRQQAGRGQYDRLFQSPPGGFYASYINRVDLDPSQLPMATLAVGVACGRVLEWNGLDRVHLKWPNDLYYRGRKIGGILVESIAVESPEHPILVIGIGLNINSCALDFPVELRRQVTTLKDSTGRECSLERIRQQLWNELPVVLVSLARNPSLILDLWRPRDYLMGRMVHHVAGDKVTIGTGLGIDNQGQYIVKDGAGFLHRIFSGSLQPRIPPTSNS